MQFKQGDACALPFADSSIDVVFSSAVIEHVGAYEKQKQMLAECLRVAKKGVFITTPNRFFPIEMHTLLPLIHWLPKSWHRFLLNKLGLNFYAKEENLNLLSYSDLLKLSQVNQSSCTVCEIKQLKTAGFISNFMLVMKKN